MGRNREKEQEQEQEQLWERGSGTRVPFTALLGPPVFLEASLRRWRRSLALDRFVDPEAHITVWALSLEVVLVDLLADILLCDQS